MIQDQDETESVDTREAVQPLTIVSRAQGYTSLVKITAQAINNQSVQFILTTETCHNGN